MTVAATSLLAPIGPLTTSLFPGEETRQVLARAQQYLDNAAVDSAIVAAPAAVQDQMSTYFALWQAFTDIYIRMSAEPLTVQVTEKGGHGYSAEQLRNMKALADSYRAQYLALIPVATPNTDVMRPQTMSVNTEVCW